MNKVFDALSHPIRREVLELLKSGGMTAGDLADRFPVSKPTMSGHFAKLKEAGLIHGENRKGSVVYTLNMSTLEEALHGFMGRVGIGAPDPAARHATPPPATERDPLKGKEST